MLEEWCNENGLLAEKSGIRIGHLRTHADNASRATPSWAPSPSVDSPSSPWTRCSNTLHPTLPASTTPPPPSRLFVWPTSAKHSSCLRQTSLNPSTTTQLAALRVLQHPDWYAIPLYLTCLTCLAHSLHITTRCTQLLLRNRQRRSSTACIRRSLSTSFNTLVQLI